jgi:hypothetical protein
MRSTKADLHRPKTGVYSLTTRLRGVRTQPPLDMMASATQGGRSYRKARSNPLHPSRDTSSILWQHAVRTSSIIHSTQLCKVCAAATWMQAASCSNSKTSKQRQASKDTRSSRKCRHNEPADSPQLCEACVAAASLVCCRLNAIGPCQRQHLQQVTCCAGAAQRSRSCSGPRPATTVCEAYHPAMHLM